MVEKSSVSRGSCSHCGRIDFFACDLATVDDICLPVVTSKCELCDHRLVSALDVPPNVLLGVALWAIGRLKQHVEART